MTTKQKKKFNPGKSLSNNKFLKRPRTTLIEKYNLEKHLNKLARETQPLVREIEPREIVRDDRSLFFNSELIEEKRRWLR